MEIRTKGDIVNRLIEAFDLSSYLEYNKFDGATYFAQVRCASKVAAYLPESSFLDAKRAKRLLGIVAGVDLDQIMDIDQLLRTYADVRFDVIFLDPVHERPDVDLALRALPGLLTPGGFLVVHDCNPPCAEVTAIPRPDGAWYGETYKAFCLFRQANPRQTLTVDVDCGVGIICNQGLDLDYPFDFDFSYDEFAAQRVARLGLIDAARFLQRTEDGSRERMFQEFATGSRLFAGAPLGEFRQAPQRPRQVSANRVECQLFWADDEEQFAASRSIAALFDRSAEQCAVALGFPPSTGTVCRLRWDVADRPLTLRLQAIEFRDPVGAAILIWSPIGDQVAALARVAIVRADADADAGAGDVFVVSDNADPQLELRMPVELRKSLGAGCRLIAYVEPQDEVVHELLLEFVRRRRPETAKPAPLDFVLDAGERAVLGKVRSQGQQLKQARASVAQLDSFYSEWKARAMGVLRSPAAIAVAAAEAEAEPLALVAVRAGTDSGAGAIAASAPAPSSRCNVLVIGRAKTGTTVISRTIGRALTDFEYFMEPKSEEIFREQASPRSKVVKIIHEHWVNRTERLEEILCNRMPLQFDKRVLICRDPRDELVSRMLYVAYPWCESGSYDSAVAARWLALLRDKEARPRAVSLQSMLDFQRTEMGFDAAGMPGLEGYIELLADPPEGVHVLKYEDFVTGNLAALESYLERPLGLERDVGAEFRRTMRSGRSGDWAHFACPEDLGYLREALGRQADTLGYLHWGLAESPSIPAANCSRYVERLFAESLRNRRSR